MEYCDISFEPVIWKDYPSTSTKLNAQNLNNPENGILKLIDAINELRNLLGTEDLSERYADIITAVNDLGGKFGGYQGYNLLDMSLLNAASGGYEAVGTLEEFGVETNKSYVFSMEGEEDVYLYQLDNEEAVIAAEVLSELDKAEAVTIAADCVKVKVFFPKAYYHSKEACQNAHVMLEKGTQKHEYEPYTGGEKMTNLWEEILENQVDIRAMEKKMDTFLAGFKEILEGEN